MSVSGFTPPKADLKTPSTETSSGSFRTKEPAAKTALQRAVSETTELEAFNRLKHWMNLECFKIKEIIYGLFDVIDCAAIAVASALIPDTSTPIEKVVA